jgi:hypothetical protein
VKISDLPQHARRVELFHNTRSLDALLHGRRAAQKKPPPGLRTVVAHRPEQLDAAHELVARRYAARGYRVSRTIDCRYSSGAPDAQSITL